MFAAVICATVFLAVLHGGESAVSWTTPSGGSGALATTAPEQDVASATDLTGLTVTATSTAGPITVYTMTTNAGSLFAVTGTTVGQLQLAANKGLDYEFQSVFVLGITATDGTNTDEAIVTVNVANEAADPVWGAVRYCVIVPDRSAAATEVTTITATVTTGTIAYGLTDATFEISSAGLVKIKASQSANRADAYQHALVVTASASSFTSTTILNICVGTETQCSGCGGSSSAAAAITFNIMTLFSLLLLLVL